MKTVWLTREQKGEVVLLLGGFDGLHLGHRFLLSSAKRKGLPVGIMTIFGGKDGQSLFTARERRLLFLESGADFSFELLFSEIKDLSPSEFLELINKNFAAHTFVCGEDFRFGAKVAGTPAFLKEWGQVCVETYPLCEIDGEKVGSSTVKAALREGDIEKANLLLETPFFLLGEVVKDRQIGRTIGFPTANIPYPKDKFPLRIGVYETETLVDGIAYRGITNYGARPTFDDDTVLTETYLDGFSGDLYGKTLRIGFKRFLRDVKRFDGAEALKTQLQEDIRRMRNHD